MFGLLSPKVGPYECISVSYSATEQVVRHISTHNNGPCRHNTQRQTTLLLRYKICHHCRSYIHESDPGEAIDCSEHSEQRQTFTRATHCQRDEEDYVCREKHPDTTPRLADRSNYQGAEAVSKAIDRDRERGQRIAAGVKICHQCWERRFEGT